MLTLGAVQMSEPATYEVRLKRRRWRVRRFYWHVRNGELRRYGYSWWQIWKLCGDRARDLVKR